MASRLADALREGHAPEGWRYGDAAHVLKLFLNLLSNLKKKERCLG